MDENKINRLEIEVEKYKKKLLQMQKNWSVTKEGSRYGDEYLEVQIKVYQSIINDLDREIRDLKRAGKKI